MHCGRCHEPDDAEGPKLDRDILTTRLNAVDLFDYVSEAMPQDNPGSLPEPVIWSALSFLLTRADLGTPPGGLNRKNAAALKFPEVSW